MLACVSETSQHYLRNTADMGQVLSALDEFAAEKTRLRDRYNADRAFIDTETQVRQMFLFPDC